MRRIESAGCLCDGVPLCRAGCGSDDPLNRRGEGDILFELRYSFVVNIFQAARRELEMNLFHGWKGG